MQCLTNWIRERREEAAAKFLVNHLQEVLGAAVVVLATNVSDLPEPNCWEKICFRVRILRKRIIGW